MVFNEIKACLIWGKKLADQLDHQNPSLAKLSDQETTLDWFKAVIFSMVTAGICTKMWLVLIKFKIPKTMNTEHKGTG